MMSKLYSKDVLPGMCTVIHAHENFSAGIHLLHSVNVKVLFNVNKQHASSTGLRSQNVQSFNQFVGKINTEDT